MRENRFQLRLSDAEADRLYELARGAGVSPSAWLRRAILAGLGGTAAPGPTLPQDRREVPAEVVGRSRGDLVG